MKSTSWYRSHQVPVHSETHIRYLAVVRTYRARQEFSDALCRKRETKSASGLAGDGLRRGIIAGPCLVDKKGKKKTILYGMVLRTP